MDIFNKTVFDDYYDNIKKLDTIFELIKKGRYDDAIDMIDVVVKNNTQLINQRDQYGNTLLYYAVLRNQRRLVEIILKFNANIDLLDSDGLHLLHYPVKYGYQSIIELLVTYANNNISLDLINMEDRSGLTIIFYAVKVKNYIAFNFLLNQQINLNFLTKKNIAIIHYLIIKKENTLLDILLKKPLDINLFGIDGESPLHLACNLKNIFAINLLIELGANINLPSNNYLFLPIYYLIHHGMTELAIKLIDMGSSLTHQDFQGNTLIHHCILSSNFDVLDYIFKFPIQKINNHTWEGTFKETPIIQVIDPSLFNSDGLTIAHLLLYYYDNRMDNYLTKLLPFSNLNLQDNKGNTIMHLISDNNLWMKFENIFRLKKINIFIKNRENLTPLDYIKGTNQEIVYQRNSIYKIVTDGYYNYLKKYPNKWIEQWEKECSVGKLTEENCHQKILAEISSGKSIPLKVSRINIDLNYDSVVFNTFVSNLLDLFAGLSYLKNKYDNVGILMKKNPIMDNDLKEYYNSIGIDYSENKVNFQIEISWVFQKLFVPSYFESLLSKMIEEKEWIIIPITIIMDNGSHSNFLLFHVKTKRIERFEPYGKTYPPEFNYNPKLLDQLINRTFNVMISGIVGTINYITPSLYEPVVGFQVYDSYEKIYDTNIGDPEGYCLLWCLWYSDHRVNNPKLHPSKLIKYLLAEIRMKHLYFRSMIRNYSIKITDYRDKILSKYSYNINDYINHKIKPDDLIKIYNEFL